MDSMTLHDLSPASWPGNDTIPRRLGILEEPDSNYDAEKDSVYAHLLIQLRMLGPREVLPIGEIPVAALESWPWRSTNIVVIVGSRRSHYLASHPELEQFELLILMTLLDPDEVHSNKQDEMMAIVYREFDPDFFLRIAVLISDQATLQLSVISARFARLKEVEQGRSRGRLRWKK